jgi:hypothetical protein
MKEREVIRYPLLEKAEKSTRVEELINSFYIKTMKVRRGDITVTSHPSVTAAGVARSSYLK